MKNSKKTKVYFRESFLSARRQTGMADQYKERRKTKKSVANKGEKLEKREDSGARKKNGSVKKIVRRKGSEKRRDEWMQGKVGELNSQGVNNFLEVSPSSFHIIPDLR